MTRYTTLGFLAVFALGALLGWTLRPAPRTARVHTDSASRERSLPAETADSSLPASLESIQRALDALNERLAGLESRLDGISADPSTRRPATSSPASPGVEELAQAVSELRALVEQQLEASRAADERRLDRIREEKPETDWPALYRLVDLWNTDETAARNDVLLLSDADVLLRYGPPTELWGDNWIYGEGWDTVEEAYRTEVYFRVEDGYVTTLGIVER